MNNEIVLKDKFVDYAGKEHQFVIAAVKSKLNDVLEDDVQYAVGIGVSICNPSDTFDEKIGTLKALGRAYKSVPVAYSYHSGQLSDDVMNAFIQQEIKYIKQHPEKYIRGYKEAYIKFQNEKDLKMMERDFSDIEKVIVEGIKKDPKYLNNVTQYIALWKKYGKKD